ncbi:ribonuclease HII [Metabacillus herbersteinensis]|uniref:Ribonuclease HII n=1 Tax=Metabacillus herbersteinensis TaxID=283816 RepID=A0ABV6GC79_9BACI
MSWTTKEIEHKLADVSSVDDPFLRLCVRDERKGVQQLVKKWLNTYEREKLHRKQFEEMMQFEREARRDGFKFICGIDEVGRGPLAGPVVAAAVILPEHFYTLGITDSKKLSPKKREEYFDQIVQHALAVGIGIVSPRQIDEMNIYQATKHAMQLAIADLSQQPDFLLIDAMELPLLIPQKSIIKGDSKSISIAASSIVAKVTRDRIMEELALEYPEYGFHKHMGYGTSSHIEALNKYGKTKHHRESFSPVKEMIINNQS